MCRMCRQTRDLGRLWLPVVSGPFGDLVTQKEAAPQYRPFQVSEDYFRARVRAAGFLAGVFRARVFFGAGSSSSSSSSLSSSSSSSSSSSAAFALDFVFFFLAL